MLARRGSATQHTASLPPLCCSDRKKLPFFLYCYVDSEVVVARGRSGGLALWGRTTPEFEAESGVLSVYK
jgi:hypothetical protein